MVSRVTLAGDFRVLEGGKEGKGGWWCGEKQLKLHRSGRWWLVEVSVSGRGRREDVWGPRRGYGENKSRSVDEDGREGRCWNQYVAHSLASCSPSAHHLSFLPSLARGETFVTC